LLGTSAITTSSSSGESQPPPRHTQRYSLNSCIQSNAVASATYSRPANPIKLTNELDHLDQLLAQAEADNSSGLPSTTSDSDFFVGDAHLARVSSTGTRKKVDTRITATQGSATTTTAIMDHITSGIQHVSLKREDELKTPTVSSSKTNHKVPSAYKASVTVNRQEIKEKQDTEKSSSSSSSYSGKRSSSSEDQADKKGSESGEDYSDDEDEGEEGYKVGGYHRVQIGDVYNQRYGTDGKALYCK